MGPVDHVRAAADSVGRAFRLWPRFWLLVALVTTAFLVVDGGSLASASRSVLHGLCAQRPTHSFSVDGVLLPFDARMTGIYLGALASWMALAARQRLLAPATPSWGVIVTLVAGVVALGIDGFNAMLVDLGVWHPYEPMNAVRFLTGFGSGLAIVSLQAWLLGGSLWPIAQNRPSWRRVGDVAWIVPASVLSLAVILHAGSWFYPLLVLALLVSAWITVTGLVLVILVLLFRLERRIDTDGALDLPLTLSAAGALGIIIGLAQLRFWLERTLGIPQDFVVMSGGSAPTILTALVGWLPLREIV